MRTHPALLSPCPPPVPLALTSAPSYTTPLRHPRPQLGILVRKGVGGTYPFQTACKQLAGRGLLPGIPKRGKAGSGGGGGTECGAGGGSTSGGWARAQASGPGAGGGCGGGAGGVALGCGGGPAAGATAAATAAAVEVVPNTASDPDNIPGEEVQGQGQGVAGQVQVRPGLCTTGAAAAAADTRSASTERGRQEGQLQVGPSPGEPSAACNATRWAAGAGPAGAPAPDGQHAVGMATVPGPPSVPEKVLCPNPLAGRCSGFGAAPEGPEAVQRERAHSPPCLKRTAVEAFGAGEADGGMEVEEGDGSGASGDGSATAMQHVGCAGAKSDRRAEVTQLASSAAVPLRTPKPATGVDIVADAKSAVAIACTPTSTSNPSSIPAPVPAVSSCSASAATPTSATTAASATTPASITTPARAIALAPIPGPSSASNPNPASNSASAPITFPASAPTGLPPNPASAPIPTPTLGPASATSAPAPASAPDPTSPPVPAHHVPLLKSIGAGAVPLYAHCCRLELYVAQDTWHAAPKPDRNLLYSAVQEVERRLHAAFNDWNHAALARHVAGLVRRLGAGQRDCGGGGGIAGDRNDSRSQGACDQGVAEERGGGGVGHAGPDPGAGVSGGVPVAAAVGGTAAAAVASSAGAHSSLVAAAAAVLAAAAAAYAKHSASAFPTVGGCVHATAAVTTVRPAAAAATTTGAPAAAPRTADGADDTGSAAQPLLHGVDGLAEAAHSEHGAGAATAAAGVAAGGAYAVSCAGPPMGRDLLAQQSSTANLPEGCSTSCTSAAASASSAAPTALAEATAAPQANTRATAAPSTTPTAAAPAVLAALPVASAAAQPAAVQPAAVQSAGNTSAALPCAALQPAMQAALNAFLASPTFRAVAAAAAANRQASTAPTNGQVQGLPLWTCKAPRVAHIPGGVPALFSVAVACATLAETVLQLTPKFDSDACNRSSDNSSSSSSNGSSGNSSTKGDDGSGNPDCVCGFPWPLYLVSTRDSFTYHLVPRTTVVHAPDGRTFQRTEYFFREDELPPDYWLFAGRARGLGVLMDV